ncbi:MAG: DUF1566 domain-containing protein [Deltaproteobacteria bacterium]|nr:DUF1566 domain-containing protein [Deltaproteobacteria bacterium]MBI3388994.1 DUF1566 domain-containing protein [Deltaproteobacteria bacterium]
MRTRSSIAITAALLWASTATAVPLPATSLNTCQSTVKTASKTYADNYLNAVATCLQSIAGKVIKDHAAITTIVAGSCATQFRNIHDTRGTGKSLGEKLTAAIDKKCAPGMLNVTHGVPDVLGPGAALSEPIEADNINTWCAQFGGDGSIDTLHEWSGCIAASHACAAQQAIVTQYPRALEWLADVRTVMATLLPPVSDPTKISDALAGLDAVVAAIDGPDADGQPNLQCGSSCGDGAKNGSEACDGSDLGGASCTSLGYAIGTLSCTATCGFNVSGCDCRTATGTAAVGDVLSGKTFSNASSVGITGTMPNNGAVTLTPGTADQTIVAGYHNGSGKCVGDTDLVAGNIKSGVNLFGINGSSSVVDTSSGTAVAADMLSGKTAFVNGSLVTGSVPAGSNVSGANGLKTFTIPNGLYAGSKTATANDTNLVASNIQSGVTIFGVVGTAASSTCGNGIKDGSEQCDASDLGGQTCTGLGYALGGSLTCTAGCGFNASNCVAQAFPETGQTTCWDAGGAIIACAGTGQDGDVKAGTPLAFTDNGDGTITDNNTKLVWEKLSDDGSIHDKDDIYTWTTAQTTKIATLNSMAFAGKTDWRLPNAKEVQSIINYQNSNPAVSPAFNTGCVASCTVLTCSCTVNDYYWSSSTMQSTPSSAWGVHFDNGAFAVGPKSSSNYARAVRDGNVNPAPPVPPAPAPVLATGQTTSYGAGSDGAVQKGATHSFNDNGDGTITDNATGLMWEKKSDDGSIHDKDDTYTWGMTSPPYTMNGTMVTAFLATLNAGGGFAGHTDWRIPNVNELHSIANYQNVNPAVDAAFNMNCAASCTVLTCSCTQSDFCWSSTTYQLVPDLAWDVGFFTPYVGAHNKTNGVSVRAVRGGS